MPQSLEEGASLLLGNSNSSDQRNVRAGVPDIGDPRNETTAVVVFVVTIPWNNETLWNL
jgi:hypothetical protein